MTLPSAAVSLPARLAVPLRTGESPVVGRIEGGRLLLDLRAAPPEADDEVARAVLRAASAGENGSADGGMAGSGGGGANGSGAGRGGRR
ncbi:hypothetical protein ACQP10_36405 [Streptosporangium sandarakinum]|uniref:hypothetical protein n=1 Tax=Streptosporangium sandarakinum TaxID=1260955 RepID=UPI003D89F026